MAIESSNPNGPRTIKASEFKAKCLKLMDEVAETGEEIVITKNGRPTARLVAYREKPKSLFADDSQRYPFIKEVSEALDRGEGAEVVWEAAQSLIDGQPCS